MEYVHWPYDWNLERKKCEKETISNSVHETMERVFWGALNKGFLHKAEHYTYLGKFYEA